VAVTVVVPTTVALYVPFVTSTDVLWLGQCRARHHGEGSHEQYFLTFISALLFWTSHLHAIGPEY
jgi:hypothetical protein